jgi:septum formation protein
MLVLASASPRRRELLAQAGFSFHVHPAQIPEDLHPNEDPIAYVTRLAREKAQAVFRELTQPLQQSDSGPALKGHDFSRAESDSNEAGALATEEILPKSPTTLGAPGLDSETWDTTNLDTQPLVILGADTTVTLDNHILGKPESPADAARMLRLLSGRTHRVITGVAVVTAQGAEVAAEVTAVRFLTLSEQEIADYVATGEPMDKAGAYAIQGRAARWIPRIEGCYFNVVGLPIALVSALLEPCKLPASLPTR